MQRPIAALLITSLAGLATMLAGASIGNAQCSNPNCFSPLTIIVGFAPGGATDTVIRLMAKPMEQSLGSPVIVENRTGAGGTIAVETVLRAKPDGKTLLATDASSMIGTALRGKVDIAKDMVAVSGIVRLPTVLVVNTSIPAKTLPEFIEYVKKNPGKIKMGSPGTGSLAHLSGELLKREAGLDVTHVPYRGIGPSLTDVVSGQIDWTFVPVVAAREQINAGKLTPLAVTSAERISLLPDVPTIANTIPGYEASGWVGLSAPKGTDAEAIARIQRAVRAALSDPAVQSKLAELGGVPFKDPATDFVQLVARDAEKWGRVGQAANIKIE